MKKVLLTAFAVMASLSLFAQGTVTFANNSSLKVMLDKNDGSAVAAAGSPYVVGLWYGASGSTAEQLAFLAGSQKNLTSGLFLGGTQNLPSPSTYTLQVRGWDSTAGDFAAAQAAGKGWGVSGLWTQGTGNPNASPSVPPVAIANSGFTGFTIAVPEPSTIALGLLGLASLFVLRRRS